MGFSLVLSLRNLEHFRDCHLGQSLLGGRLHNQSILQRFRSYLDDIAKGFALDMFTCSHIAYIAFIGYSHEALLPSERRMYCHGPHPRTKSCTIVFAPKFMGDAWCSQNMVLAYAEAMYSVVRDSFD